MVRRIYVEKKPGFDIHARHLMDEFTGFLGIAGITAVRVLYRYDMEGLSDAEYFSARPTIFSEPPVDTVYDEDFPLAPAETAIAIEYLPGQYDQRADSAAQCIQIMAHAGREHGLAPLIRTAQIIVLAGTFSPAELEIVKGFVINPVESRPAGLEKKNTLAENVVLPPDVALLPGFIAGDDDAADAKRRELGLAMSRADIVLVRDYFRDTEKRNPTITEIRMLDTYWSDHCRHTTFLTHIDTVTFEDAPSVAPIRAAFLSYQESRDFLYGVNSKRPMFLMDMATVVMKELRRKGILDNMEDSEENNACSIEVAAEVDGEKEIWLVMFKNETHNHPTEIEPFGGAATCLGGAIRDPLSGRSYVYQAMRVSGAADPRAPLSATLPGKLPQRVICTGAAQGYSSYGNQIGLATGMVSEIYHPGYVAKRMEIGAVVGAGLKSWVRRDRPVPGDVIVLLGGRTGRDGCGGATGSSKEHTTESLEQSGAEVQKGNPPTERKIQRLFRNKDVSRLIKKCNDFGAGGVSVAIGELADGVEVNLDLVPKKYDGLDGTELSISESQERMAVVVAPADVDAMIAAAEAENLEAIAVATVTDDRRVCFFWRGQCIVDISRDFIDTNGAPQHAAVEIRAPHIADIFTLGSQPGKPLRNAWLDTLSSLAVCAQKGLVERFDGSIGAGSVLMPFGGRTQLTPTEAMAAKLPILSGETDVATVMAWGFDPLISSASPFHGAVYAVVESVARVVATGASYKRVRLTLQEYFERLGTSPERWGKPFAALLGALDAQKKLGLAAIGGKDSMSGTFEQLDVPPTLVSFALSPAEASSIISPEFKQAGSAVFLLPYRLDAELLPNYDYLQRLFKTIYAGIQKNAIVSASVVRRGGVAAAVSKMSFGNMLGFSFAREVDRIDLFCAHPGFVVELSAEVGIELFAGLDVKLLGTTTAEPVLVVDDVTIALDEAIAAWTSPLETVYPVQAEEPAGVPPHSLQNTRNAKRPLLKVAKPRVFIPVFPGTNCEYDSARAFERAGAVADVFVVNNLDAKHIDASLAEMARRIAASQIVMLPGGFSAGDEPEGSGKFIAAVFRNPGVKDAVNELLKKRDGLMLGICNGFQALIKLGLVPYGEIGDMTEDCPTLTFNNIGRHVSLYVDTVVTSTLSPWFANVQAGDIHSIPVSHGEGRFAARADVLKKLLEKGQIATQYVDHAGRATHALPHNPNGSIWGIEGITSPDGRVLGKMGHSERVGTDIAKNIPGKKDQGIFVSGVKYFL